MACFKTIVCDVMATLGIDDCDDPRVIGAAEARIAVARFVGKLDIDWIRKAKLAFGSEQKLLRKMFLFFGRHVVFNLTDEIRYTDGSPVHQDDCDRLMAELPLHGKIPKEWIAKIHQKVGCWVRLDELASAAMGCGVRITADGKLLFWPVDYRLGNQDDCDQLVAKLGKLGTRVATIGRDGAKITKWGGVWIGKIYECQPRKDGRLVWRLVEKFGHTRIGIEPSRKFVAEIRKLAQYDWVDECKQNQLVN